MSPKHFKRITQSSAFASTCAFALIMGLSPASASQEHDQFLEAKGPAVYRHLAQQSFTTAQTSVDRDNIAALNEETTFDASRLKHGFDVRKTLEAALSEVGTTRPTGWSAEGECVMSVRRWLLAGGANWGGGPGTPVGNYKNATRVPLSAIAPGDVIQYEHLTYPDQWVSGVHTMLVTAVNPDGTLQIVQSNIPFGSGLVTVEDHFTPRPPEGFRASIWRF